MNSHVHELIAFEYPEDWLLEPQGTGSWSLCRGNRGISVRVQSHRDWFTCRHIARDKVSRPSVEPEDTRSGKQCSWQEDYAGHGFSGEAFWHRWEPTDTKESVMLHLNLLVIRGSNHLEVYVHDRADFSLSSIDDLLRSICFPDEKGYLLRESRHDWQPSRHAVELPAFAAGRPRRWFNVEHGGEELTEPQSAALLDLRMREEAICEKVIEAVFQLYTGEVYPALQSCGLCTGELEECFPNVQSAVELVPYYELRNLLVHLPRDNGDIPIGLTFTCSWDAEHDLGVRIHRGEIEATGLAEAAFWRDLDY